MLLDIIHRPVFIYKHHPVYFSKLNVSETGFCLRLEVKSTQLGPIDRASPYLRRYYFSKHDVSETGFCLRFQVKLTQLGPIDRDRD
jgi:hypothetical protein